MLQRPLFRLLLSLMLYWHFNMTSCNLVQEHFLQLVHWFPTWWLVRVSLPKQLVSSECFWHACVECRTTGPLFCHHIPFTTYDKALMCTERSILQVAFAHCASFVANGDIESCLVSFSASTPSMPFLFMLDPTGICVITPSQVSSQITCHASNILHTCMEQVILSYIDISLAWLTVNTINCFRSTQGNIRMPKLTHDFIFHGPHLLPKASNFFIHLALGSLDAIHNLLILAVAEWASRFFSPCPPSSIVHAFYLILILEEIFHQTPSTVPSLMACSTWESFNTCKQQVVSLDLPYTSKLVFTSLSVGIIEQQLNTRWNNVCQWSPQKVTRHLGTILWPISPDNIWIPLWIQNMEERPLM